MTEDEVRASLKAQGFKQSGKASYAPHYEPPKKPGDYPVSTHFSHSDERWWDELGNHVQAHASDAALLARSEAEPEPATLIDRGRKNQYESDLKDQLAYYRELIGRFGWSR